MNELLSTNSDFLSLKNQVENLPAQFKSLQQSYDGLNTKLSIFADVGSQMAEIKNQLKEHIDAQSRTVTAMRSDIATEFKQVKADFA